MPESGYIEGYRAEIGPDGLWRAVPDFPHSHQRLYCTCEVTGPITCQVHNNHSVQVQFSPYTKLVPADGRTIPNPQRRNSMLTKITWAVFCQKQQDIAVSETEFENVRLYYGRVIVQGHPTAALQVAYDFLSRCFANHGKEWHIEKITFERNQELEDSEQEIEVEAWEA